MSGVLIASWEDCAKAQNITLDGTLGPAQTLTGPIYNINQAVGQTVGSNLFHSFGKFNLDAGERANFYSDSSIRNILTRVTGGSQSLINGLIYTDSARVNLFLINPSGIVFGPDARLDVGGVNRGSFVATTVDALVWPNGGRFSATNPQGPNSLLTIVGDPGGFLSSQRQPQPIVVRSGTPGLSVYPGQSLLLLGGDVSLDGGTLIAEGGRVELGGVAGEGTIGLSVNGNDLRLSFPVGVQRAEVSLDNSADVNVRAGGGGSIAINAQNLNMAGNSRVRTGIASGLGSVDSQAGDIEINVTGTTNLTNFSFISNAVLDGAVGKSGNINITTGSLFLSDDAFVSTSTFGQGDAGNVTVTARDTVAVTNGAFLASNTFGRGNGGSMTIVAGGQVSFDGASGVFSDVEPGAVGNGGDIYITAGSLSMSNGAGLFANTFGKGDAGNVTIQATGAISFDGVNSDGDSSGVYNNVAPRGVGKGGNINIMAGSLSLTNGAELVTITYGQGYAGSVIINVRDTIFLDGVGSNEDSSGILSRVGLGGVGKGGDINITTGTLSVSRGALLSASTFGQGNAGNVTITARDTVSFYGVGSKENSSGIFSNVGDGGVGKGGDISITTGTLFVTDGAGLEALTKGQGDAGNVTITACDTVLFDGVGSNGNSSGAFSTVETSDTGNGGNINITTGSLLLTNGAQLSAVTSGHGNAGNIRIQANDQVYIDGVGSNGNNSGIFSAVFPEAVGNGGNIKVTATSFSITNAAGLTASSFGNGAAGNIQIEADSIRLDNQAVLEADTIGGEGNINIKTADLILRRHSSITTNAIGTATGGNITINADNLVAVPKEDSDISANAQESFGGRVIIDVKGIFGIQFRPENTPLSDITATSALGPQFSGIVQITTPDVDPSQGLSNLPTEVVDASNQIAQNCHARGSQQDSSFTIIGRGGLPTRPGDAFTAPYPTGTVRSLPSSSAESDTSSHSVEVNNPIRLQRFSQSNTAKRTQGEEQLLVQGENVSSASPASTTHAPLVEATGWVYGANGDVILTAQAPTVTPHGSWSKPPSCQ